MASPAVDWTVPTPLRTLVWWPAVAFVLVVALDDASLAIGLAVVAGLALAGVGALVPPLTRRLRRVRTAAAEVAADTATDLDPVTRTA